MKEGGLIAFSLVSDPNCKLGELQNDRSQKENST